MTDPRSDPTVLGAERLAEHKAVLERLNHERLCLRITDRYWEVLKARARKSTKPMEVALQGELDRAADAIKQHYGTYLLDRLRDGRPGGR